MRIKNQYDAVVLAGGSEYPRDLPVEGRELDGVHFAADFLPTKKISKEANTFLKEISAKGKDVMLLEAVILAQIA